MPYMHNGIFFSTIENKISRLGSRVQGQTCLEKIWPEKEGGGEKGKIRKSNSDVTGDKQSKETKPGPTVACFFSPVAPRRHTDAENCMHDMKVKAKLSR